MDDDNFCVTYEEGLKVSVPKEYLEKRGYFSFIKFLVINLFIVIYQRFPTKSNGFCFYY